jgi:hypothetical protein
MSAATPYRLLDAGAYAAPVDTPSAGLPPQLEWLPLRDMCVDERFQRPVTRPGRAMIETIAREFSWAAFQPVIVAPVPGGRPRPWSIIDGQHRCLAALLIGLERVPAMVVRAPLEDQARLFVAVNTNQTRVNPLALFHSRAAAVDGPERHVRAIAEAARVEVLRYPVQLSQMKPRQTMASGELLQILRHGGRDDLRAVLDAAVAGGRGQPGVLTVWMLRGLRMALARHSGIRGERLQACFAQIDLPAIGRTAFLEPRTTARAESVRESVDRRISKWIAENGAAAQRLAGGTVTTGRHGVSLPRLASLDREASA